MISISKSMSISKQFFERMHSPFIDEEEEEVIPLHIRTYMCDDIETMFQEFEQEDMQKEKQKEQNRNNNNFWFSWLYQFIKNIFQKKS